MSVLNNVLSASGIQNEQWIAIRITPDQKSYSAWVVDPGAGGMRCPREPLEALRSATASTISNAVLGSLPTLGT